MVAVALGPSKNKSNVKGKGRKVFTRWTMEAGGPYPLMVHEKGYEVTRGESLEKFRTWKALLTAVHGEGYAARHWPRDRYLKEGQWSKGEPSLVLVGPPTPLPPGRIVWTPDPPKPESVALEESRGPIIIVRSARPPGIDLAARGGEVAKLLYAGFSSWILTSGYDFEDVLQEVYRKILVANVGRSPWSPEKSTFGHYVHLVCRSALSNFHRKARRISSREQLGIRGLAPDGTWKEMDVADGRSLLLADPGRVPTEDPVADLQHYILSGPLQKHPDAGLAARLVPFIHDGHTLKDSAVLLGVERPLVSKAMALLREAAMGWSS